ncbi:MAG TPA: metal-dependent hydrolase [Polyangiaceae bacterium]|jgi:inner membrane protein
MASIGHVAVGMAAARWFTPEGRGVLGAMIGFSALSMLPDLDVVGFRFGVAYGAPFGHRGASHSLVVAAVLGFAAGAVGYARSGGEERGARAVRLGLWVAGVVASHGLLDAMTDGGKGVALLWPFTRERFFFPWRPIPVAPIGAGFLSMRGMRVAAVELFEFAPLFAYGVWGRGGRWAGTRTGADRSR